MLELFEEVGTNFSLQSLLKLKIKLIAEDQCENIKIKFSCNFCRLLITFARSLDPDQARQKDGPDLEQNCLTL